MLGLAGDIVAVVLGIAVVARVLISAVQTFVLPRGAPDRLTGVVFTTVRRVLRWALRRSTSYAERDRVMAYFAPTSLLILPVVWLSGVLLGYGLLFWGAGIHDPGLDLTISGSSLLTLGIASGGTGGASALTFSEAAIGLTLAALLIAYLPTMYSAFSRREAAVTSLETRAGSPPTVTKMLVRLWRIGELDDLRDFWITWEAWFYDIQESHTSLAPLIFYRSPQADRSWVTAAGCVLDTAAMVSSTLDRPRDPRAELCIRGGYITLRRIADLFQIAYDPDPASSAPTTIAREEYDAVCDDLAAAGIPLKPDRDATWLAFNGWRVNYDAVLVALAMLTMAPNAQWSTDRVRGAGDLPQLRWDRARWSNDNKRRGRGPDQT